MSLSEGHKLNIVDTKIDLGIEFEEKVKNSNANKI
jgi:hypothetical protein